MQEPRAARLIIAFLSIVILSVAVLFSITPGADSRTIVIGGSGSRARMSA